METHIVLIVIGLVSVVGLISIIISFFENDDIELDEEIHSVILEEEKEEAEYINTDDDIIFPDFYSDELE